MISLRKLIIRVWSFKTVFLVMIQKWLLRRSNNLIIFSLELPHYSFAVFIIPFVSTRRNTLLLPLDAFSCRKKISSISYLIGEIWHISAQFSGFPTKYFTFILYAYLQNVRRINELKNRKQHKKIYLIQP